jgi:hypothetical protein
VVLWMKLTSDAFEDDGDEEGRFFGGGLNEEQEVRLREVGADDSKSWTYSTEQGTRERYL